MITLRNKILQSKVRLAALALMSLCATAFAARAQVTILATNTDMANGLVFAEIVFEGTGGNCMDYNLRFKLESKRNGASTSLGYRKPTVLNVPVQNAAGTIVTTRYDATVAADKGLVTTSGGASFTAKLKNNDSVMYDLRQSAYSLVFDLPSGITPEDSVMVCMESVVFAGECKGCGIHRTDIVFSGVDPACTAAGSLPENMVSCRQRDSRAKNFEGWVVDPRDCQPYRVVKMPDGKWWFAQNLNYHDQSGYGTDAAVKHKTNGGDVELSSNSSLLKTAWCPGGPAGAATNATSSPSSGSNNTPACATYGALYPWATAMSLDGDAADETDANLQYATKTGDQTSVQGICPKGWRLPSRADWGRLLNTLESECNTTPCSTNGDNDAAGNGKTSPCFHNYKDITTNVWAASQCAFKDLLGIDVAPARGAGSEIPLDGNLTGYADTTRAAAYQPSAKLRYPSTIRTFARDNDARWNYFYPATAGTDRYGFSIKPSGVRNGGTGASTDFYYRGEFAGFWTSSHASDNRDPKYGTAANAYVVGFRYNYRHNADFNSAVMSWAWDKKYGLAVRCIQQQ